MCHLYPYNNVKLLRKFFYINNNNGHGSRSTGMKALKLPPFNEEKDALDAHLTRFERACVAFEVRPEHRSTQLVRLLQ